MSQNHPPTTHLTVLRDLHLLPLRHLGDVEMTLGDPRGQDMKKHQWEIKTRGSKKHFATPAPLKQLQHGAWELE